MLAAATTTAARIAGHTSAEVMQLSRDLSTPQVIVEIQNAFEDLQGHLESEQIPGVENLSPGAKDAFLSHVKVRLIEHFQEFERAH